MRSILVILILIISLCSCGQSLKQQQLSAFIKIYSDSINNFTKYKVIPAFLEDSCFDYNPYYWPRLHQPISLRSIILKKVNNIKAIDSLIVLNRPLFRSKCTLDYEILEIMPNINKSFYDLLLMRQHELSLKDTKLGKAKKY